jgi:hypothetical protein
MFEDLKRKEEAEWDVLVEEVEAWANGLGPDRRGQWRTTAAELGRLAEADELIRQASLFVPNPQPMRVEAKQTPPKVE